MIVLTKHQIAMQSLAKEIYDWCWKKGLWGDNILYFNGKAWSNSPRWYGVDGKKIGDDLYEYEDKDPRDYFEYANPNTLSMSYEGPLFEILNGYYSSWSNLETEFLNIFEKYGLYAEYGHAWNLTAYKI